MLVQHLRLGYIYPRKLIAIVQKNVIKITSSRQLRCIACLLVHVHQVYSRIPSVRPTLVYYLVSVDVILVRQPSLTKDQYATLFTEAKALEREISFLSYKSAAAVDLKSYYQRRKNAGYSVVVYRLDGGKEYSRNALLRFAAENGIRLQIIPLYTSTKNSRAEVSNYIVCTNARKMIIYANLLPALQAKAIGATVYILNLTPSNALDRDFLRHVVDVELSRAVNPKKPLLNTLRVYGAIAIVYNEAVLRGSKVEVRGERGQLVGYKDSVYRIWIALKHKVKRLPYCQFIKEGELAEIPSTVEPDKEDTTQQFEYNLVKPRGELLVIPNGYTIETVNPDMLDEDNESFT